jgi:3-dehydroquinate synthase
MAPAADAERLAALLTRFGLPTERPADCMPEALVERMRLDKKTLSDRLRLILWRGVGRAQLVDGVDPAQIVAVVRGG